MNKLTIDALDCRGKSVLVRVDFNVPIEGSGISDDTRIVESLPTIKKILSDGGRAILMSHLGRPKGKKNPEFSLAPVAKRLSSLLGQPVAVAPDCIGAEVETMCRQLRDGECLLLENLRFHPEEEANDSTFARSLASLGNIYVNDAFGTAHRAHASTEGITHFIRPCVAGYLMEKELDYLGRVVSNPARPYVAIIGGAKISGKIEVIQNLLKKVDALIIGGGMMFTFYRAMGYETGKSLVEEDKVSLASNILQSAAEQKIRFHLPVDCIAADKFENNASRKVVDAKQIPPGWMGLDIGPDSLRLFSEELRQAKTIVWNGPMGVFEMENFSRGTIGIAEVLAERTKHGATTIIGGGDSAAAITQIGLERAVSHVSTGGGASLEFLEGKTLPGVAALNDR